MGCSGKAYYGCLGYHDIAPFPISFEAALFKKLRDAPLAYAEAFSGESRRNVRGADRGGRCLERHHGQHLALTSRMAERRRRYVGTIGQIRPHIGLQCVWGTRQDLSDRITPLKAARQVRGIHRVGTLVWLDDDLIGKSHYVSYLAGQCRAITPTQPAWRLTCRFPAVSRAWGRAVWDDTKEPSPHMNAI
jgi:hypothetical protein